jgi:uroporphyrinogen-III synthase
MKDIEKLLEPLNLIYYEFDLKEHMLVLDKNWEKENIFAELIKVTYTLSSHNIKFFIDENRSIVIAHSDSFINKIKRYFKSIITNIMNSRLNIYILSDKKVKWAKNLPMIEIKLIEQKIDFFSYDALIFTSKNAVYSIDKMDKTWREKPSYTIAPQTAKIIKHFKGNLKFVGKEKHGNAFALELIKNLKHKKVLYIRGTEVVSDLVNILNANSIVCEELIIYETICKEYKNKIKIPKNSTIIFSSPSTIKCFLHNITWDKSFKAISIGHTTAQYFPEYITPIIADTTSLESCVKKAIESYS